MIVRIRAAILRGVLAGGFGLAAIVGPASTWGQTAAVVESTTTTRTALSATREVKGIPRFSEIEPGLARGGQPNHDGYQFLREQGYKTVVSFRKGNDDERRELERMGITYIEIPLRAGPFSATPPTDDDLLKFFTTVGDSARRPVFIHCLRGRDRTGAMTALYRIQACGWTNEDAVKEMKERGFRGHYKKLKRFVREYLPREGIASVRPGG
jgi:protein tyrosine phosphatase (PTP) superfamily phosphohydrolase (DUF442 family)